MAIIGTELEDRDQGDFGDLWTSSFHKKLVLSPNGLGARASRGSGRSISFIGNGIGAFSADGDINDRLITISGGYRYIDISGAALETYDTQGRLVEVDRADGGRLIYSYSDSNTPNTVAPNAGYLLNVGDQFGRVATFRYDMAGRILRIINPSGYQSTAGYDAAGNLVQFTWPDTFARNFLYENSAFPWALTGIISENNARYATVGYDALGRAISTQLAGGVDRYGLAYSQAPTVKVSDTYDPGNNVVFRIRSWNAPVAPTAATPTGSSIDFGIGMVAGTPGVTSQSQPAGSGCGASTSYRAYDVNGNIATADDFNGNRACLLSDLSRNLTLTRVDGLSNSISCSSVTSPNAALPSGGRKSSTVYHPDWRLQTARAEPLKLTTMVYNGQPDPFAGGAKALCAPSAALLPDGKPIVVLCRQVEQATTDADGHLGFSAAFDATAVARQQTWTYNQYGQVLSAKGPRVDVNDTTSYIYYPDTTADHTMGDLAQMTNAVGQVTNYTAYNKTGQLLRMVEPNGVVTVNTYDLRQRLTASTVGGLQTTYTYDPVGQLIRLTQPDTTAITYTYDDAHRLTRITDQAGNAVTYTLDNAGNRTQDQISDVNGALTRTITRAFDALGRVQQVTGAAN